MNAIEASKVVAALPTRGLIYARTISSLTDNGVQDICIVEGKPIPECHNEAVRQALKKNPTHVWMVEEDHYYPPGTLSRMLELNTEVACVNYPVGGSSHPVIYLERGEIMHCGTGCMLVESSVFDRLPEPWFDSSKTFMARSWQMKDQPRKYGGQDIYFGWKVRQMGIKIKQVPNYQISHLRCTQLQRIEDNSGSYQIREMDPIKKGKI